MRLRPFCETLGDLQTKAIFNTMHQSLAKVKAKTPDDTLHDAENEASLDTLADSIGEIKAKKVG